MSLLAAIALVLPPTQVQAEPVVIGALGTATTHAAGMPVTTEPWRTLVSGTLNNIDVDSTVPRRDVWSAFVKLGGPPPAGENLTVSWAPGAMRPEGCVPLTRFTETASVVDAANIISIERRLPGGLPETPTCLEVTLVSMGILSDELTGQMTPVTSTAGPWARVAEAPVNVAVGRPTPVILVVASDWRDSAGDVSISGSGSGIRMRALTVRGLVADQPRLGVARISATRGAGSTQMLAARDDLADDGPTGGWELKAREVEAQRPRPGRYASMDGSLRFRVTQDHRVVRLRTSHRMCLLAPQAYPGEIDIPRSGAAAEVIPVGRRWFGAQLMTRRPGRIQGSFAFATHTCARAQQFVARRLP